jgi:myo-inositol-1(or 4)-monophosphatase
MTPEDALGTAVEAAHAAGAVLRCGFSSPDKDAREKGHAHDPVTVFDREAEEAVLRILTSAHPEDGVLSEESDETAGRSGRRWVVDPLDGTNNFLAGIPHFAVSIALEDERGVLLGCVYDPMRDELFAAVRGSGARLGDAAILVSERRSLDGAVIAIGFSHHPERRSRTHHRLPSLLSRVGVLRGLGSAALDLAYTAAGRFDACWYESLSAWDIAAGVLLVEEAGGRMSDLGGAPLVDPDSGVAASNGRLHDEFVDALAG